MCLHIFFPSIWGTYAVRHMSPSATAVFYRKTHRLTRVARSLYLLCTFYTKGRVAYNAQRKKSIQEKRALSQIGSFTN